MKRTYVDITGEYYDNQDDLLREAYNFGLRDADLRRAFRLRHHGRKKKTFGK